MSDQRDGGISWTDQTWNPVRGCSRVSQGCTNCYAERVAARFSGPGMPYEGLARIGKNGARWTGDVRLVPEHLADPLRWRRARKVFVNSMSDLFHEGLTNEQIAAVFGVMAAAPQHTFQVLTKRAKRMYDWFVWASDQGADLLAVVGETPPGGSPVPGACAMAAGSELLGDAGWRAAMKAPWPLPNVWIGVSAEDQVTADERIPFLRAVPAAVRWVSYEPALGPVDLSRHMWPLCWAWDSKYETPEAALAAGAYAERKRQALVSAHAGFLNWVIVGGESGPGARPFKMEWAASIRDQCTAAGVAFFFKQAGSFPVDGKGHPLRLRDRKGGDLSELGHWPREFPR